MADVALDQAPVRSLPRVPVRAETLRRVTLWLMVFGGSLTMFEPSPYELFGILAMFVWGFGALKLSREMMPIIILLALYMTGALITLVPVMDRQGTQLWTAIGWFLAFTGVFYMMVLAEDTSARLATIINAYILTATIASLLGSLAYFHLLPGSDNFLIYDRVKSTFEDPNVFGPFLVLPLLVVIQRIFIGGMRGVVGNSVPLLIMLIGLFLSFSRGAWGHFVAAAALMTLMTFICAGSSRLRSRMIGLCVIGLVFIAVVLMILLSFDAVRTIFEQRANLDQSYDLGHFGRFNRWILGFVLALDKPIGIGMLQFGPMFGEDTHNTYLNAFMSYGWLGGIVWPAIPISTVIVGWAHCFKPSPWRHVFICIVATYTVVIMEAWVIDIDHWRHAWLLFGAVWGLSIATARLYRQPAVRALRLGEATTYRPGHPRDHNSDKQRLLGTSYIETNASLPV